jgi:hypothetical protein
MPLTDLSPEQVAELHRRAAEQRARYGPPRWPLSCFVCRQPVLETFFAYACCDECLDALLVAPGIGSADLVLLQRERGRRWADSP